MEVAILEREALLLPESQRALLADRLLQTLGLEDQCVTDAWVKEAEQRLTAFQLGEITASDGPSTIERLRSRLR